MKPTLQADSSFMRLALALAERGLGRVWPNPSVGCVLVKDGQVVGRGWTADGGRPHAETQALRQAGSQAIGATAYVSLEPCAHHGKTPPCANTLADAQVKRVVIAVTDPDPRVAGRGIEHLKAKGISVDLGLCAEEAHRVNAGFFTRLALGRPLTCLKIATSLDGRIATRTGHSRWITGPAARAQVHRMRAKYDGVMIGIATALADDPMLDCRLAGLEEYSPVRIVLDTALDLPLTGALAQSAGARPVWVLCSPHAAADRRRALEDLGIAIIESPLTPQGRIDLGAALRLLGQRGLTRLLIEGGAKLSSAMLQEDLIDLLAWFRAPLLIGGDGVPAFLPMDVTNISQARRLVPVAIETFDEDRLELYDLRRQ